MQRGPHHGGQQITAAKSDTLPVKHRYDRTASVTGRGRSTDLRRYDDPVGVQNPKPDVP